MQELNYKLLSESRVSSNGAAGTIAVKIMVATSEGLDLKDDKLNDAAYYAVNNIMEEVQAQLLSSNLKEQERATIERAEILGLFGDRRIYIEDIPNGYCKRACCRHRPWFIITTNVGRFKIGWRKRVISIDWTETRGTKTSEELFATEDVTKDERMIHAWSLDKAREYINSIHETAVTS